MGIINRYDITKKIHSDYLILIVKKNAYFSYGKDAEILNYLKFNGNLKLLEKKQINYLVLDNLDIVVKKSYEVNNISKYELIIYLDILLREIRNKLMVISE